MRYSEEMICSSVIKAITPGSYLRTYLESKHSLTLSSLIEVMRSHFREKDSTSIFSELSNAVQAANESCLDFIIRVMCLREKVILFVEKGCAYDSHLVNQRFSHTILTGLRNNNIRNELRIFLKNKHFADEELLKVVTEAVANETEHSEKTEKRNIHHHHSFNVSVPLKVGCTAPMFVLSFFLHSILLAGSALDRKTNKRMLLIQPSFLTTCPNQRSRLYLNKVCMLLIPSFLKRELLVFQTLPRNRSLKQVKVVQERELLPHAPILVITLKSG